jgi:hypothetical protein
MARYIYKHFQESIIHLYRECPEGSIIGIAKRDVLTDESDLQGLEVCEWCQARGQGSGLSQ